MDYIDIGVMLRFNARVALTERVDKLRVVPRKSSVYHKGVGGFHRIFLFYILYQDQNAF